MHIDILSSGAMQVRDINPSAAGVTTAQLTNPRVLDNYDVTQQIILGKKYSGSSPLVYILGAGAGLIALGFLQKAR